MVETKTEIEYAPLNCTCDDGALPVIIAAAGNSSRMQGISKIFEPVCGVPVIVHTLRAFENSEFISQIVLVTKDEDVLRLQELVETYGISKVTDIVVGGDNRQESVKNGLKFIDKRKENVLIHDGARPLVSAKVIENVVRALSDYKCVVCGVKVKDTIKVLNDQGFVEKTLDRNSLVSVQTPQGVCVKDYKNALINADTALFTDDASIMESANIKTFVTEGDYKNIKITTREDLKIAEEYLKEGRDAL